ncbi:hypothetical protein [Marinimicrococcus flavescens]|uniref:DUF883 family protein n=1 Tax=Marinimicrococcus flavescens TaxID=3031815 RepID=A0AAP3UYR0_9PROT|nr:hypothetical protein [Marinimicrococcus flavescens]
MASHEERAGKAAGRIEEGVAETADRLKASYEQLRRDVDQLRQELLAAGGERGAAARTAVERRLEAMRHELEGLPAELREKGQATAARVEAVVRERPVTSLLAAFGIGMLIAHLLERR